MRWMLPFTLATLAMSPAGADEVPPVLVGSWHEVGQECGTPTSDLNGLQLEASGLMTPLSGPPSCLWRAWKHYPRAGKGLLGQWTYRTTCPDREGTGQVNAQEVAGSTQLVILEEWPRSTSPAGTSSPPHTTVLRLKRCPRR
jgi:hypothetical protein